MSDKQKVEEIKLFAWSFYPVALPPIPTTVPSSSGESSSVLCTISAENQSEMHRSESENGGQLSEICNNISEKSSPEALWNPRDSKDPGGSPRGIQVNQGIHSGIPWKGNPSSTLGNPSDPQDPHNCLFCVILNLPQVRELSSIESGSSLRKEEPKSGNSINHYHFPKQI